MLSIDDILPKCDLDESKEEFNKPYCIYGKDPFDCDNKKYYKDHIHCGIELKYNEKVQKLYEKWLEQ